MEKNDKLFQDKAMSGENLSFVWNLDKTFSAIL